MNKLVADIICATVRQPMFAKAIEEKIGKAIDTSDLEKHLEAARGKLRLILGTKTRLEQQLDSLDESDPHFARKNLDLQRRYDEQYDLQEAAEEEITSIQDQIQTIRQEQLTGDNIYRLLLAFDKLYNTCSEAEQKELMRAIIERIDLYPEKPKNGCWIRKIVFNFPVSVNGEEVKEFPLDNQTMLETVCALSKLSEAKYHVNVQVDMDELDLTSAESLATYDEIREWVQE